MKAKLKTDVDFYGVTIPKGTIGEIKEPMNLGDCDEYDYVFIFPAKSVAIKDQISMLVTSDEVEVIEDES